MLKITGTFLDEISCDIPHQNWGRKEWERDFRAMKSIGIDTVIMIRCGWKRWMTYPSQVLARQESCHLPPTDLVEMFLDLAEANGMNFFFGTYDSGNYWYNRQYRREIDLNLTVAEEAWRRYGSRKAFKGWYITQEVSRSRGNIIDVYAELGRFCKEISGGLPTLISPHIDGKKAVSATDHALSKKVSISLARHEQEWNEIMAGIKGAVDIVAFQDGHCDFEELGDYLTVNSALARRYGIESWTNCETFDRDMPIKFLPIKWEKMLLKLQTAERAGITRAITFEFSHFMSPNSCYLQAGNLYNRYCEYLEMYSRKAVHEQS